MKPEQMNREEEMRGLVYAAASLIAVVVTAPARAGEIYVIENGQGNKVIAAKKDVAALAAVPVMPDGKPNQGFNYAKLYELPGANTHVMRGHVDAKGSIAVHEGPLPYILYVISGSGKLSLNDKGGAQIGEVTYKPDDVIVFQPNTLHGWTNGDSAFEFLGVELPAPQK
ncbi:cupin domain-containing protein [uncultured Bradyrhizobium sp.]|uniref:cupin domain-containing protein n=1 Tax=uncultured Bradyrhizobium sp. TaxID=199684 RepID=UPI0026017E99|nr:cupin domain-containing protein [uncultured Bradyrhizobium sp.]